MAKVYDRAYFEKWYRGPSRVTTFHEQRRKVTMAVSAAEYFLRHPLRNVLDVGCGEAPWFVHLKALRPRVSYLGVDPSEYAVNAFANHRHVRSGSFNDLSAVSGEFDLVVCSDVMHYLTDAQIETGLPRLTKFMRGLGFFEAFTKEDHVSGDVDGFHRRPALWYRERFREAGLVQAGPYLWLSPLLADEPAALEKM